MRDDEGNYNIITLKNIDDEDFVFSVDKRQYIIQAGQIRRFPKFIAELGVKHLVDKLLIKENPEGKLLSNMNKRDEVTKKIVIDEEGYEKPTTPTLDEQIEEMNVPSDLDNILKRNKQREDVESPDVPIDTDTTVIIPNTTIETDADKETFAGLDSQENETPAEEESPKMPNKTEMLEYAENTLKMNLNNFVEIDGKKKQLRKLYTNMSDEDLYKELQMGE